MDNTLRRTFTVGQHTVSIHVDPHAENPRSYSTPLGVLLVKQNRHFSGDRDASADEIAAILANKKNVALPVYAYVHSGVALSTAPFSCPWDSGFCGVIFVPWEKAKAEGFTKRKAVVAALAAELAEYDAWQRGDTFGYEILGPDGAHVDSCWGFYGPSMGYCVTEATRVAQDADTALSARQKTEVDAFGAFMGVAVD